MARLPRGFMALGPQGEVQGCADLFSVFKGRGEKLRDGERRRVCLERQIKCIFSLQDSLPY